MAKTQIIADKYVIFLEKIIGQGNFSSVYKGCLKDNKNTKIAIKIIKKQLNKQKQQQIFQSFQREKEIQSKIVSEFVVKIIDTWSDDFEYYIILEYCKQGNLTQILKKQENNRLPFVEGIQYLQQIVQGYKNLHKNNAVHRDLKSENILFHQGVAKIADFGFSRILEDMDQELELTFLGTPEYSSPEILKGQKYSSNTDMWSLGCILFEMLYGFKPFILSQSYYDLIKKQEQPIQFPQQPKLDNEIIELIKLMLKVNPSERLKWDQLFSIDFSKIIQNYKDTQITQSEIIRSIQLNNDINQISKKINHFIKFESDKRDFHISCIKLVIPIQPLLEQQMRKIFILYLAVLKQLQLSSEKFSNLVNGKTNEHFSAQQCALYKKSDKFQENINIFRSHQNNVDKSIKTYFPQLPKICLNFKDQNLIQKLNQYRDYSEQADPAQAQKIYLELLGYYMKDLIECYRKKDQLQQNRQVLEFMIIIDRIMNINKFTLEQNVQAFRAQLYQAPTSELKARIESIINNS